MQSGELDVIGKDHVSIHLKAFPSEVRVKFKHHPHPVPCNPHHRDDLEWEVLTTNRNHSGFVLVIKWSVASSRKIVWQVCY